MLSSMAMETMTTDYTENQGWTEWETKFKPIKSHFRNDPDETMFETYGEEVEFVAKGRLVWLVHLCAQVGRRLQFGD